MHGAHQCSVARFVLGLASMRGQHEGTVDIFPLALKRTMMHREPPSTFEMPEDIGHEGGVKSEPDRSLEVTRYTAAEDVRFRPVLDEGVVIRQRAGEVLVLNAVGVRILELIAKELTLSQIVDALLDEFLVERKELERDVLSFTSELERAGVLERCGEDEPELNEADEGLPR